MENAEGLLMAIGSYASGFICIWLFLLLFGWLSRNRIIFKPIASWLIADNIVGLSLHRGKNKIVFGIHLIIFSIGIQSQIKPY